MRTCDNINKIATGKGNNYTAGCLLDCNYFWRHYKLIAIHLSEQKALDADPKAIHQINSTGNLDRDNGQTIIVINEKAKETGLDFLQGTVKVF